MVKIDGKWFLSKGGICTSGDNRRAVSAADVLLDAVNGLEQRVRANPYEFAEAIFQATGARPSVLRFKLLVGGTAFSLEELTTRWRAPAFDVTFNP